MVFSAFLSRREKVRLLFPKKIHACFIRDSNPNPLLYKPTVISPILAGWHEKRYLEVTAKRNRQHSTSSHLSCQITSALGTIVSRQTIFRPWGRLVYMLEDLSDVFPLLELTVTCG
ncbi:hypothetical protein TNCV_4141291 [Trichonephila clavipes]|nr:hypothetical protein TNCV_4141291 [Trichonephila clavipes]